jgi:uncharacterized membrane protein YphA (DoxX/SURF4 family)
MLRAAVGFAFLYPPIDAIRESSLWVGYLPPVINNLPGIYPVLFLHVFGIIEIALAVWVFSGWKVRFPAFIMFLILMAIVLVNGAQFPILFRDISIAFAALALAFLPSVPKGVSHTEAPATPSHSNGTA